MRATTGRTNPDRRQRGPDHGRLSAKVVALWGKREIPTAGKDIDNIGQMARAIGYSHEEAETIERLYRPTPKTRLK